MVNTPLQTSGTTLRETLTKVDQHSLQIQTLIERVERLEAVVFQTQPLPQDGQPAKTAVDATRPDPPVPSARAAAEDAILQRGVAALKEWTARERATVVYDSRRDPFTSKAFFNGIAGRSNVAVVGFTNEGDVFGGYYTVAVTRQGEFFDDPDLFLFSFEARGRCETPQRFAVNPAWRDNASVIALDNERNGLLWFWVNKHGGIWLGNDRSASFCCGLVDIFVGLEQTALTGRQKYGPYHTFMRLVAIQME